MENSYNMLNKEWDEIENFLLEIFFKERKNKYVFNTGEFGMLLFAKAINLKLEEKGFVISNQKYNLDKETVKGSQFVVYKLPNGVEIKIQHDPNLDKKEDINEITGFPNKSSTLYYEES